jgi:ribosomal protein S18 acetylase RimI-like enzyme
MTARGSGLRLKAPRTGDRDRVLRVVEATGVFRPEEVAIAMEVFDGAVEGPGVDYHAVGAFDDDDALVGFTCYGPTPCTVATWDLYWIAVDPAAYRHGVGRALMEAAEQAIADADGRLVVVETSSRADYAATRAFYGALGYAATARIPDFYAANDDLIVYTKRLVSPGSERADG